MWVFLSFLVVCGVLGLYIFKVSRRDACFSGIWKCRFLTQKSFIVVVVRGSLTLFMNWYLLVDFYNYSKK